MNNKLILYLIIALLVAVSCRQAQKLDVLIPEIQYMADTMFANRRLAIIAEIDSLCTLNKETELWKAVDSLLLIQARRIEELTQ